MVNTARNSPEAFHTARNSPRTARNSPELLLLRNSPEFQFTLYFFFRISLLTQLYFF